MNKHKQIKKLFNELVDSELNDFPQKGHGVRVTKEHGVYIIYCPDNNILHVGKTDRGIEGLSQRLNDHRNGKSSFSKQYLEEKGKELASGYKFKYLVVKQPRKRTFLEAYSIGVLWPKHIGTGEKK